MKKVLIGGIGNVLLGDDGVGPYLVRTLAAEYEFDQCVEVMDLGTPALELVDNIAGKDAVILVDSVDLESEPGSVLLYRKSDIVEHAPSVRMDPHSPALVDAILSAELFSDAPAEVLLIGMVGESFEPGCTLSPAVSAALGEATAQILGELDRLGIGYKRRQQVLDAEIWWTATPVTDSTGIPLGIG